MLRSLMLPQGTKFISTRGLPIDISRNKIVVDFMKTNAEWLFFLDADVHLPIDAIPRLIKRQLPIISGLYYTRFPPIVPVMWKIGKDKKEAIIDYHPGDLVQADAGGAGCLLIHRSVIEKMEQPYFNWTLGHRPEKMESMSEDFYFQRKLRTLGYKFIIDTSVVCKHEANCYISERGVLEYMKK